MADILDKDFETAKILKELKEDVGKVKKTMCEPNENINKEIENLTRNQKKKNSGPENYNN